MNSIVDFRDGLLFTKLHLDEEAALALSGFFPPILPETRIFDSVKSLLDRSRRVCQQLYGKY